MGINALAVTIKKIKWTFDSLQQIHFFFPHFTHFSLTQVWVSFNSVTSGKLEGKVIYVANLFLVNIPAIKGLE